MEETKKKGCGCGRAAGIGCGMLGVVVLLSVVLVAFNLDAIKESDWYRSIREKAVAAKQEVTNMLQLRKELQPLYPAQEILVNIHSSRNGKSLGVEFVNPDFDIPEEDTEQFAKNIAAEIASRYPEIERYDNLVVSFVKQSGAGVTIKNTQKFPFPVTQLNGPDEDVLKLEEAP